MASVAILGIVTVLVMLAAPLALYWFVSGEEPDDDGTSWDDARRRARNDDGPNHADNEEDGTDGNHWS